MKALSTFLLLGLLVSLNSCLDHRGFVPENELRVPLLREWTRLVGATDPTYTGYTQFNYDGSGRLTGTDLYFRTTGSNFAKAESSMLTYDSQGRLEKETITDASGTGSYNYSYDGQNRINKIETDPSPAGRIITLLTYDAQNRVNGRTETGYNGNGDVISTNTESYEFDTRNNVTLVTQTYVSAGSSFRRQREYTYDQGRNPLYQVPIYRYSSIAYFNSPNNVIKSTTRETSSLSGPFEPVTSTQTLNFVADYQAGLLFEKTDNTLARQYQYDY